MKHSFLFWQPSVDYLKLITSSQLGRITLIIINYLIWVFLFYISYLLIKSNTNTFWQILFASFLSELIERFLKSKVYWVRPMFIRHDSTPIGLVDKWYKTGSFPSGHSIKAMFFLMFLLANPVFSIPLYLLVIIPLLTFRVFVGFHYPVDMVGGLIIGYVVYLINSWYTLPTKYISLIFNTVFFIK